jgi:hypothetical protein
VPGGHARDQRQGAVATGHADHVGPAGDRGLGQGDHVLPSRSTTGSMPRTRHSLTRPTRSAFPSPLRGLMSNTAFPARGTGRPGCCASRPARARWPARIEARCSPDPGVGQAAMCQPRPTEPTARAKFLQVRQVARQRVAEAVREQAPELPEASVRQMTTYAMAGADGLFIAREIGGENVDLLALFELHARTLIDIVGHELAEQPKS